MSRTAEATETLAARFRREAEAAGLSIEAYLLRKLEATPPSNNEELFEWLRVLPPLESGFSSADVIRELRGPLPEDE